MDAYLTKPARLASLQELLEHWLPRLSDGDGFSNSVHLAGEPFDPVDLNTLKRVVGDDAVVLREFIVDFRSVLIEAAEKLDIAVREQAVIRAGDIAHQLKSSARTIGAHKLGNACEEIEIVARARSVGELLCLLPRFRLEAERVLHYIQETAK